MITRLSRMTHRGESIFGYRLALEEVWRINHAAVSSKVANKELREGGVVNEDDTIRGAERRARLFLSS